MNTCNLFHSFAEGSIPIIRATSSFRAAIGLGAAGPA